MAKLRLDEENMKIMQQLKWDFRDTNLSVVNINKDIVELIAEMTVQAIQMSQESEKMN